MPNQKINKQGYGLARKGHGNHDKSKLLMLKCFSEFNNSLNPKPDSA